MNNFIEIKDKKGNWHYININHIEEVAETEKGCTIYFAFSVPDAIEQDYIETDKSYDDVKIMIWKAVQSNGKIY